MLKIAVCEDHRETLNRICADIAIVFPVEHKIYPYPGSEELMKQLKVASVDVVITDIELPGQNGIEMAKAIKQLYPQIKFVFVTEHTDYIQDAFSVDPVFYLLKPVDSNKLLEALTKATEAVRRDGSQRLSIASKNKVVSIRLDEVEYIESYRRVLTIHEQKGDTRVLMKLDDLEKQLPNYFLRCHQSYLVNMNCIKSVAKNCIQLFSGQSLPVPKAKATAIRKEVIRYMGECL